MRKVTASGVHFRGYAVARHPAGTLAVLGAVLAVSFAASSASAVGPYPPLGACSVFPQPPASLSPRAPSLPSEAAWNQDISRAPRDPRSAAYIAYIDSHGLVRYDEVASGPLDHAIRVTSERTREAWVHPASRCAGDTSDPAAPPMGLRLRLKSGYGLGGFSGPAKTIALAMKRYGLIVADNGSNWFFSGSSDRRWNDGNLNQLKRIPGSAFEVVKSAARVRSC